MASEVTVSSTQGLTRVVSEVVTLLETNKEARITAINMAIPSAVNLVELLKHRVKGLYQHNSFEKVPDSNKTRVVFLLSLKPIDPNHKGYQAPIAESEVQEKSFAELKKPPQQTFTPRPPQSDDRPSDGTRRTRGFGRGPRRARDNAWNTNTSEGRQDTDTRPRDETRGGSRGEGRGEYRGESRGEIRGERRGRGLRGSFRGRGGSRGGFRGGPRGTRGGRGGFNNYRGEGNERRREPGMEKYELVRKRDDSSRQKHELFVSATANPIFAIKDGLKLFKKDSLQTIVIKASGQALAKAVRVAEEIKRKEPGLHQLNSFSKKTIQDRYRSLEEGLDDVVKDRTLEGLEITLSKAPLDKTHSGYQPPLPNDKVTNLTLEEVENL